jgi:DNA primase
MLSFFISIIMITTNILKTIKYTISPKEVYEKYIDNVVFDKKIKSPLRNDDDTPSFIIYSNTWLFNDFGKRKGDYLTFVQLMFNLKFNETLNKIQRDFKINGNKQIVHKYTPTKRDKKKMFVTYRDWNNDDKLFWESFGVSKQTLLKFEVLPVSTIWFDKNGILNPIKADKLAYCYKIGSRLKIYQPMNKEYKFFSNTSKNSIQGYNQIDYNKNHLIITSSLKDVMVLYECGYQAVAPSSESTMIDNWLIEMFCKKIKNVVLFYDWDKPGLELAKHHSIKYNIPYCFPINKTELLELNIKDPSDYCKIFEKQKTINFLNNVLTNIKNE